MTRTASRVPLARGSLALLAAAALLSGCSSGGGDAPPTSTPGTSASASPSAAAAGTSPSASADPSQNGAADAGVDLATDGPALATASGRIPTDADPEASVTAEVLGLKRNGKLLVLTARLTRTTTQTGQSEALFNILGNAFFAPYLVDPVNLKQYTVVTSATGARLTSQESAVRAFPGQPMYVFAVFAAPPADVTTLDVTVHPQIPTMQGVPVS